MGLGLPDHAAARRRGPRAGARARAEPRQRGDRARRQPRRHRSRSCWSLRWSSRSTSRRSRTRAALALGLAAIALAALVAFVLRQRRAATRSTTSTSPRRRVFWVAACAGIIVFGSLMGAMFIGQQFLQNVLGYSTLEAGAAILPAAVCMVLVAPRSAKLVERHGARFTLLARLRLLPARLRRRCCCCGTTGSSYWQVGLGYAFIGIGVGFAGTPASHSLTGSVPVTPRRHGVGHRRPAARPRRRDHAVDPRRPADRGLRRGGRGRDRGRARTERRRSPTASRAS